MSEAKIISLQENLHLARSYIGEGKSDSLRESGYLDYINSFAKLYEAYPASKEADLSWNQANRNSFQAFAKLNREKYESDIADTQPEKEDIKAIISYILLNKDSGDVSYDKAYLEKLREQIKGL